MKKFSYFSIFLVVYLLSIPSAEHQVILILSLFSTFMIFYQILFSKIRLSINNIFLFGFAYFMFLYPIFYSLGLVNLPGYSYEILYKSVIISFLALVLYITTYNLFFKLTIEKINFQMNENIKKYKKINKFLFMFSLLIFFFYFTVFGQGVFNSDVILFTGILFFFYLIPKKHYFTIIIIFLFFAILTLISSSGRRDIIKIILIFLFYMQIYYGNFSIFTLFLGLCFTVLSMAIITALRSFSTSWDYSIDIGIIDLLKDSTYLDKVFTGYGSYLNSALVLGDFGVAYNNYVFIIKNISEIGYLYGQSFIRLFTFFIPRSIWTDKPFDVQILIMQFNNEPFYTSGSSQSTSLVGEVFWNFGYLAIIVFFFFIGLLNKKIDNLSVSPSPYSFLIIMSLVPFFMLMWRGSFTTTFVYALANILILCACLMISRISLSKNR